MDKPYIERDKQINARINPKLHAQLKKICESRDVILSTLIERLIELGLPHYLETNAVVSDAVTKDDLVAIDDRLKKLESLIEKLTQSGNNHGQKIAEYNQRFSNHSVKIAQLQKAVGIENLQPPQRNVVPIPEPVVTVKKPEDAIARELINGEILPIGTELSTDKIKEYLSVNPESKSVSRDIFRAGKRRGEEWESIERGLWKRIR